MQRFTLSTDWTVKQRNPAIAVEDDLSSTNRWLPANVPGTVHQDLMAAGQIADPFFGLNENDVQWVGQADWLYRCTFNVLDQMLSAPNLDLCFDGLDTFATIWLNGQQILVSDNMFVPARVAVKALVKPGENSLHILFESALRRGQEREAIYGKMPAWNGDASRVYVRKAQYHYGWDWGPVLLTAGVWKPIVLEAYQARIVDVSAPAEISADLSSAALPVSIVLANTANAVTVHLALFGPSGGLVAEATIKADQPELHHIFQLDHPELWYPRGYGSQPRYRLVTTLSESGQKLDQHEMQIGLRRLRLVQEPLQTEPGTSFYFEINNVPVFSGGANWIPADNFLTRLDEQKYRQWLTLAAEGNMIMLRVWGGGIYESDAFYDICDELGLLVWQDFLFACGIYPAHDWFQASVLAEVEAALRRLRHHASIVLWCGNNEDYQIAQSFNWYDASYNGDFTTTHFPARAIYERRLPDVCARLDPTRPYWPGSPYGGSNVYDQTIGDRHTWEVWHGPMAAYQDYTRYSGRFISEFGMQALPDLATIETFTTPEDRYPHSRVLEHHNKATAGERRIAWYVSDLHPADQLEEFIYNTQFIQSEAIAAGVEGWRRHWSAAGNRLISGALVWQINDCWPVTSWALVDSLLRPKPAYYRLRRSLAPISVGIARFGEQAELWAVNGTLSLVQAILDIQVWTLDGEQLSADRHEVTLMPNATTEFGNLQARLTPDDVISVRLISKSDQDQVLTRSVRWPEPPKYFAYPVPNLRVERVNGEMINVSVERPARAVYLNAAIPVRWSDNMLDLMPGDPQVIEAIGLKDSEIAYIHSGGKAESRWQTVPLA